ncbi:MAG: hypothetical protein WCS87_09900 [Methylococcaceae bacterium]
MAVTLIDSCIVTDLADPESARPVWGWLMSSMEWSLGNSPTCTLI